MKIAVEQYDDHRVGTNFVKCKDVNRSGIRRFNPSPVMSFMLNREKRLSPAYKTNNYNYPGTKIVLNAQGFDDKKYVIPTGVGHNPNFWTGKDDNSVFALIDPIYLKDLRNGDAILLLDQTLEGYQGDWMWSWFHAECQRFSVNPKQIIYITGNYKSEEQYKSWSLTHLTPEENRICVIADFGFEFYSWDLNKNVNKVKLPSFDDHVKYKSQNLDCIKTLSVLQKRPRSHRIFLYKALKEHNLLDDSIYSMSNVITGNGNTNGIDYFGLKINDREFRELNVGLPVVSPWDDGRQEEFNQPKDEGFFTKNYNENVALNTWVTVVSETFFADEEQCAFISEKTFKQVLVYQPFIVYGPKGTLAKLRERGYKTFDGFINEEYDSLDTVARFEAIVKEMKRLVGLSKEEKMNMYLSMENVLEHNYQNMKNNVENGWSDTNIKVFNHVKEVFGEN